MAKKRVIAFPMHEHELAAAAGVITGGGVEEGLVVGEIDEADLSKLRELGVIVRELDPHRPAPATVIFRGEVALPESAATIGPASSILRLPLAGPLLPSHRVALDGLRVEILDALPDFALKVRIQPPDLDAVNRLPFLAGPAEPIRAGGRTMRGGSEAAVSAAQSFDILLRGVEAQAPFLAWLGGKQVAITGVRGAKVRVVLPENSPLIEEISGQIELVDRIEVYITPELHNDCARVLLGIDQKPGIVPSFPFEGTGEIVAVADTGIDDAHPDFAGRIVGKVARGRPPVDTSDPNGHGTHVAGSVLGDGAASGGRFRGTAPKARLFFQSLLDPSNGLGGLPFTLDELFEEAYQAGARIHNNSWGSKASSTYRANSSEVDDFVHRRKDMLIVISAGNEGSAANPPIGRRNAAEGYVDWLSIGAPATCKNALTVGASRSGRTEGGHAAMTYRALGPDKYSKPPIGDQLVSADPQSIGAFSSRGPCDDYRIKPDVVAPGTDIISCRSSLAPVENFWGPDPNNPRYAFMGGTSMAAPLVAGCAALAREYFVGPRGHAPSAALLKATLINGTRRLSGTDAVADYPDLPNYHQGFGAVYLPTTLPSPLAPEFCLEFVDNWNDPSRHFGLTGRRHRYRIGVAGGLLRLCLVYTDAPGRGIQNNLDLLLEVPGANQKRFGNERVPRGFNGPDPNNNVETITVTDAPPGDYLIQISATNILKPAQDYALVVTGRLTSGLTGEL